MARWNRYVWTPEQDAAIRRVYEARERGGNKRLAARWNVSPRLVSSRAARLGLPPLLCVVGRVTGSSWREAELALVRAHLGEPIAQIRARLYAKGHSRSLSSVCALIRRHRARGDWPSRVDQIEDSDRLTVAMLCAGLGVNDWTVHQWIRNGWLRAHQVGGNGLYVVRWVDLHRFLCDCASHWDHRQADHWFLIEALSYGVPQAPGRKKAA